MCCFVCSWEFGEYSFALILMECIWYVHCKSYCKRGNAWLKALGEYFEGRKWGEKQNLEI